MATESTPTKIYLVREDQGIEGHEDIVAALEEEIAEGIAKTLNAFSQRGSYYVDAVPIVPDVESIRKSRLTLSQEVGRDGTLGSYVEKNEVVWAFGPSYRYFDVEDFSTKNEVVVAGFDHAMVRELYRVALESCLERRQIA